LTVWKITRAQRLRLPDRVAAVETEDEVAIATEAGVETVTEAEAAIETVVEAAIAVAEIGETVLSEHPGKLQVRILRRL
jgi:hypothetical protein